MYIDIIQRKKEKKNSGNILCKVALLKFKA